MLAANVMKFPNSCGQPSRVISLDANRENFYQQRRVHPAASASLSEWQNETLNADRDDLPAMKETPTEAPFDVLREYPKRVLREPNT